MSERYTPSLDPRPLRDYFDELGVITDEAAAHMRMHHTPAPAGFVYVAGDHIDGKWYAVYGKPRAEVREAVAGWLIGGALVALQPRKQIGGANVGRWVLFATDQSGIGNKAVGVAIDYTEDTVRAMLAAGQRIGLA